MDKYELKERFIRCLAKADITGYNISFDEDEMATLYVDQSDELFFEGVKTNYTVGDIKRIMFYYLDEGWKSDNYIKISFSNGDYLVLHPFGTITALIAGSIYHNDDVLRAFKETAPALASQGFLTSQEILQKLKTCIEKSGVCGHTIQEDEDQIADLMFDSDIFIIGSDIETPYTVGDFKYIKFFDGTQYGDPNQVVIGFKNGEELLLSNYCEYEAWIYDGKHRHFYDKDGIITKYSQRVAAINQGKEKDEFVILDGVLSAYNGDSDIITVPEGVNYIERGVFEDAEIMEIFFPDSLTAIGDCAFRSCWKLERIHLNEGLVTIGDRAFCGCVHLVDVELPTTIREIKNAAFLQSGIKSFARIPDGCIVSPDVFEI